MNNFRYELQKGSRHLICPNCGKKTFKPYVEKGTNNIVDASKFGRCERINNCSYSYYPDSNKKEFDDFNKENRPYIEPTPDFIPTEVVESTFKYFGENVFFNFLTSKFGIQKALKLQRAYNIGTAKNGGTIFWQKDREGAFRTGKVMYYQKTGKRIKDRNSWYLHTKIKKDYSLVQVFFGEHLIDKNKPIALCESEKTAILMSVFEPEYTWLAAGGANMLSIKRLIRLPHLSFVSPDQGTFKMWENQTSFFKDRQMDIRVEKAYKNKEVNAGADILDLILMKKNLNDEQN